MEVDDEKAGGEANDEGITRRESAVVLPTSLLDMDRSLDGLSN